MTRTANEAKPSPHQSAVGCTCTRSTRAACGVGVEFRMSIGDHPTAT